jgi:hypothetical protein
MASEDGSNSTGMGFSVVARNRLPTLTMFTFGSLNRLGSKNRVRRWPRCVHGSEEQVSRRSLRPALAAS